MLEQVDESAEYFPSDRRYPTQVPFDGEMHQATGCQFSGSGWLVPSRPAPFPAGVAEAARRAAVSLGQFDQRIAETDDHRRDPIIHLKFFEKPPDIGIDRRFRYVEYHRHVRIRLAARDPEEDQTLLSTSYLWPIIFIIFKIRPPMKPPKIRFDLGSSTSYVSLIAEKISKPLNQLHNSIFETITVL